MLNMKTAAGVAAAAATLLALAGCSAGGDNGGNSAQARNFSAEDAASGNSATPTPTETPWAYTVVDNGEQVFLDAVKSPSTLRGIDIPSDDELLADARAACRQLAAGTAFDDVDVIAGDPNRTLDQFGVGDATNSRQLAGLASETLCTEYSQLNVPPAPGPDGQ